MTTITLRDGALIGAFAGAAVLSCVARASTEERFVSYSGRASAADTGAFLYGEVHLLHFRGEQLVERAVSYTCQDGSVFARKQVDYVNPLAPDFALEDVSNGMREGVRSGQGARSVFFRRSNHDVEKSALLELQPDLVIDAGFDDFIRSRWQMLTSGHPQTFTFVVPSRVTTLTFAVRYLRSAVSEAVPSELFELKVAGVIGWVAPSIQVYYSSAEHVLITYDGVTDLRDAHGDNYKAHIVFPSGERKAADGAAFDAARRVTLRPCK